MPSEITGENAERTNARSISLQTWIRPFWMTVKVTGSRFEAVSGMASAYRVIPSVARNLSPSYSSVIPFQQALDHRAVEDFVGAVGDVHDAKRVPGMMQA